METRAIRERKTGALPLANGEGIPVWPRTGETIFVSPRPSFPTRYRGVVGKRTRCFVWVDVEAVRLHTGWANIGPEWQKISRKRITRVETPLHPPGCQPRRWHGRGLKRPVL